ncbi:MAG TPA: hypothetical protein VGK41_01315 [Solirubrobacterales bacterium]
MADPKPCSTCALYYGQSGRCAEHGIPAEAARRDHYLCGPEGHYHSSPPPPLGWGRILLLAVAALVVIGAALVHHGVLP